MPFFTLASLSHYFFNTAEECDSYIAANPVSPGGGTLSPTAPVWFRFNKAILNSYLNSSFIQNIGPNTINNVQLAYIESPRNQGVNSKVESKGFRSSQTGNVILPDAIAQEIIFLQGLAAKLLKSRSQTDRKVGEVILFNLNQTFQGLITFTQALINIQPFLDQLK